MKKEKENHKILYGMILLVVIAFVANYEHSMERYNTSMYALSYRYGFISRGFVGTIYQLIDAILPIDMYGYDQARWFTLAVTVLVFGYFIYFVYTLQKEIEHKEDTCMIGLWFLVMVVASFSSARNFGRVDIYMLLLSLMGAMCIFRKKHEWLVIPMAAVAVMIHQGYVFMYFNIILVMLCYQGWRTGRKRYYGTLFLISFVTASALFLYFELFSHGNGEAFYAQVVDQAKALSENGQYHESLIAHEILGVDPSEDEWKYHVKNFVELPILLLCLLPYLSMGARMGRSIWHQVRNRKDKWIYLILAAGPITILPDLLIKCDYGRWMLSVFAYILCVLLLLLAMKDEVVVTAWEEEVHRQRTGNRFWQLLWIYPFLLVPFWDVNIDKICASIGDVLNQTILHLW